MQTNLESAWTPQAQARWQRIADHRFEDADAPLDFCAKLAREQGWSRTEARAAIEEYRRFCFLAAIGAGDMVPSIAVDEVWHLHLTYTRDYWDEFCPRALGFPFHHDPGGLRHGDSVHYRLRYAETLAEYERWFGSPPARWWPGTAERFRAPSRFRRVDRERAWVVPKPRLALASLRFASIAGALAAGLLASGRALAMPLNPLDWQGPAFLVLFLVLMVASIIYAAVKRRMHGDSGRSGSSHGLDASGIALLAGGEQRVIDRVVGELMARKAASFDADLGRLRVEQVPRDLDPAAHEIATALERDGSLATITARVAPSLAQLRTTLVQRGLLLDAEAAAAAARASALAPALVLGFGVLKIAVGVARERPVAILVVLCVIMAVVTLGFFFARPSHSRPGRRVLAELKQRHARAMRAPRDSEWPIALALAGTAVMSGTVYAAFHDYRQPPSSTSNSSSSDSSSSSSSSSDSGGDSGGSGCGGCGGGGD
jgi:uncharacterized protein (TIGR04222 family)